jgi:hypothetical protein
VYTDAFIQSRVNSSDLSVDNLEFKQEYVSIWDEGFNGIKTYDMYVLKPLEKL